MWNPQGTMPLSLGATLAHPAEEMIAWACGGRGWCREVGNIPVWQRAGAWRQEEWALWMKILTLKWNHLLKEQTTPSRQKMPETCSYTLNSCPACTLHASWRIQRSPVSTAMNRLSCCLLMWVCYTSQTNVIQLSIFWEESIFLTKRTLKLQCPPQCALYRLLMLSARKRHPQFKSPHSSSVQTSPSYYH